MFDPHCGSKKREKIGPQQQSPLRRPSKKRNGKHQKARYASQKNPLYTPKSLLYIPIYIQKVCYTCCYTSKKLAIHLLYIAPKLNSSRENPLYTKIPLRYTCYTLLYMVVSPTHTTPTKTKKKTKKQRTHAECAALPLHAFFLFLYFSLRGNAAACVCAALPLHATHTLFSRARELELVAIRASLKQHRQTVIDCLCMKPLRSLECNCKDLVWPLYGPLEGSWKTFGRPLEGPWKTIERPM